MVYTILCKKQLAFEKKTNNKKVAAVDKVEDRKKFHKLVRLVITLAGKNMPDPKWGRFQPHTRYNVDQVPMPFVTNLKNTMAESGENHVWPQKEILHIAGMLSCRREAAKTHCNFPWARQEVISCAEKKLG